MDRERKRSTSDWEETQARLNELKADREANMWNTFPGTAPSDLREPIAETVERPIVPETSGVLEVSEPEFGPVIDTMLPPAQVASNLSHIAQIREELAANREARRDNDHEDAVTSQT